MTTKAQLRDQIKQESRIKSGINLDPMVDVIVEEVMRDHCNKARYHELLVVNGVIAIVDGQQDYSLPANYQNLKDLRYGRGTSASVFRVLKEKPALIRKTSARGLPLYYEFIAGNKVSLWPYLDVLAVDSLIIDYYSDPVAFYIAEDDTFPVARLQSVVKKEVIARVQRYHSSVNEAQLMQQDAASSFTAAQSSS